LGVDSDDFDLDVLAGREGCGGFELGYMDEAARAEIYTRSIPDRSRPQA